jgi:hypothetical protein
VDHGISGLRALLGLRAAPRAIWRPRRANGSRTRWLRQSRAVSAEIGTGPADSDEGNQVFRSDVDQKSISRVFG